MKHFSVLFALLPHFSHAAELTGITPVAATQYPQSGDMCCSGDANGDDLTCGYQLEGGDRLARSSTALGDLDGDKVPDVALGSSRDGDGASKSTGAVYVLNLNSDGSIKHTQKISAEYGFQPSSKNPLASGGDYALQQEDRFGYAVGQIG